MITNCFNLAFAQFVFSLLEKQKKNRINPFFSVTESQRLFRNKILFKSTDYLIKSRDSNSVTGRRRASQKNALCDACKQVVTVSVSQKVMGYITRVAIATANKETKNKKTVTLPPSHIKPLKIHTYSLLTKLVTLVTLKKGFILSFIKRRRYVFR